jgi:hypothetical protein
MKRAVMQRRKFIRENAFAPAVFSILFFAFGPAAVGQNITATISGTITDATGAVIPNATVIVHSNDTNSDVRTVGTDHVGNYVVALLPVGNYTLTVRAHGFEDWVAKDVSLHVGDHLTIDAQLHPGVVTQEVTVEASAAPVETSDAAQSETVTGTQIRELELNNRNFEQLVTLQPGVANGLPATVGFGIENTDSISVDGARNSANNWTVDGSDVNDTGSNATLLNVPSVDALSEFTLERGTYDAQYGRSGGGQVNVVTKSGTSQFHGTAYEFVRNDVFNANDFFANSVNTPTPPFRYNDFGYTIGGPVFIPGHYNTDKSKTFFFWSEEWRRTRTPGTNILNVPLPQELSGDFSGISYNGTPVALNPASAAPGCIANNVISPSCFSKNAVAYLQNVYSKFTPNVVPAAPSGLMPYLGQYVIPENALSNYRQEILRVDQKINSKIQVFGRYMQDAVPTTEPGGLFAGAGLPGISSTATNAPGRNIVAHVTMSLSPALVNEAAFNYSWGAINSNLTGLIDNPTFASALDEGTFPYRDPYGRVPGISFPGGDAQGIGIPVSPYFERNIDKQVYDNLTLVRGNHSIRFGGTVQYLRKSENAVNPTNGSFTFATDYGNPAFANFLLGDAHEFSQASRDIIPDLFMPDVEAYVQDDWKVRPNLTINVGLRWAFLPTPTDQHMILDNFDPALYNAADAPMIDNNPASPNFGNFVPGQAVNPGNYANGIIVAHNACIPANYFEPLPPAAGATCSPYGNRIAPDYNTWAPRIGFAWDPFRTGKTSIRGGYGIYYDRTLNGIFEQNSFANPPFVGTAFSAPAAPLDNFDNPTQGSFIPLGPAGIHSTGTPAFRVPYNQQWSLSVQREIMPNTLFEVAYVGNKGTDLLGIFDLNQVPLSVRTANPAATEEALRPYLGFDTMSGIGTEFNSNYNSLQVSLNRRMTNGLTLGVAYTWAKTLTNNPSDRSDAPYDTYNFAADYGPASFGVGQNLIINYVYDLPFYKSQRGLVGHVLGGWEVSGITTFQQGFPTTITQCCDPFNSFDYAANTPGTYPGGIGIDPSVVAPRPDRISMASGPGTVAEYINTSDYGFALGHFGNSGRGVVIGPGLNNWDIAGIKNIKLSERFNVQFRAEFFNAFNHPSFDAFNSSITSPFFGQLNGDYEPRIIQFGLKLNF